MSDRAKSDRDSSVSQIALTRAAWVAAMKVADVDRLVALATDDIVIVLSTGKCLSGKDELRKNLASHLALFDIELRDTSNEIIVHDEYAIQFSEVVRTLTAVRGGPSIEVHSITIAVFSRQSDTTWKITRVLQITR